MVVQPQPPRWTVEAYLAMERGSPIKHEYLDGYVYAMAGGSRRHSRISVNVTTQLGLTLREGACLVFNSDMKVQVDSRHYVYPDAAVSCDWRDTGDGEPDSIRYPVLIVEVLSDDSTAGYDRGDKFNVLYKRLETLHEYMLVDSQRIAVTVYRRAGGEWIAQAYNSGDAIALESLGVTVPIEAFYERVVL